MKKIYNVICFLFFTGFLNAQSPNQIELVSCDKYKLDVGETCNCYVKLKYVTPIDEQILLTVNPENAGTLPSVLTILQGTDIGYFYYTRNSNDLTTLTAILNVSSATFSFQKFTPVVISEIYGGGDNSIATYNNDYVQLFNNTNDSVNLTGWSIQYNTAFSSKWYVEPLLGIIPPHSYFLVVMNSSSRGSLTLIPIADYIGNLNLVRTRGSVALVNNTSPLLSISSADYLDLVGYGITNFYEGSPTISPLDNFSIISRKVAGFQDTDNNYVDFEINKIFTAPKNSLSHGIQKASQTITFPPLSNKTFGDTPFILSATSTSGLPITFTIPDSSKNIISIKGDTVTILKPGKATIIANQAGNDIYNKADSVSISFTILTRPVQSLLLTSVCSDSPAWQRKWKVRSDNTFPVSYTWEVYPNIQTGTEIAQPGDNFFVTSTVDGANTTKIYWSDESGAKKETVKASGGEDCKANCFATSVVNFSQGKTKKGTSIEAIRSDPKKALGAPQDNDTYNFVSLGFGGSITLELAQPLFDNNGYKPDFILVETSFGRADEKCFAGGNTFNYPETAVIEVSDGLKWKSLPNEYCRTSFVDISPVIDNNFKFVKLIRIKDFSNKDYFDSNADGFDVDGIIVCPDEVEKGFVIYTDARNAGLVSKKLWDAKFYNRAPNEAADEEKEIAIYPNPVSGDLIKLDYPSTSTQSIEINIYNSEGAKVSSATAAANSGNNTYDLNISKLKNGLYVIRVLSQGQVFVKKFVKL